MTPLEISPALIDQLPALQVVVPLIAAILVAFLRRGTLAWLLTLVASWICVVVAGALLAKALTSGPISYAIGAWPPPIGIEYRVDITAGFILLLISAVNALIVSGARRSIAFEIDQDKQAWFYCCYLLCLAGLLGIAITGDAFNAFVFLEISSLATYTMIALGRDPRALIASYQYLIMGTIGATLYVIGVGLLFTVTGTLNFVDMAARLAEMESSRPVLAALAFITVGLGLKVALFPLHLWLPNAYAFAPSIATAFLAATATKVAIYLLIRLYFSVFGADLVFSDIRFDNLLLGLSLAAMFGASLVAVFETNVKRMLAYSSVAQIGYITLGIALANQPGLTGGIVHLANHAVIKGAFFLSLAAVAYRLGSVRIEDMAGIGRRMPWAMSVFTVAGLAIVGVPGTAGFVSKWYLAMGAMETDRWWLVVAIVGSSFISAVYVGRALEVIWLRKPQPEAEGAKRAPISLLAPTLILAAATIYFGLDVTLTADVAGRAAMELLGAAK